MNSKIILRNSIMLIVMLLLFNTLVAQDKITFTWQGSHGGYYLPGHLVIRVTNGEEFTIDWGDDTPIETKTGLGSTDIYLSHEYYDFYGGGEYTVTIVASSTDCMFTYFDCSTYVTDDVLGFQISSLTLDGCPDLTYLYSKGNSLHLSDLYAAHLVINEQSGKLFGVQYLPYQPLTGSTTVDFFEQRVFGGVETVFRVWKKYGEEAIIDVDYTIDKGIITFINDENYYVEMTNDAIISHPNYPAVVIAGIDLTAPVNIRENSLPNIKIYPNPTSGSVYIKTESETIPKLKLYSLHGRLLQQISNTEIDMSNYPTGVYLLSIDGKTVKVIKQ